MFHHDNFQFSNISLIILFQAVIDVKDFNPRDLQVKVVDERIVLEGRYDVVSIALNFTTNVLILNLITHGSLPTELP